MSEHSAPSVAGAWRSDEELVRHPISNPYNGDLVGTVAYATAEMVETATVEASSLARRWWTQDIADRLYCLRAVGSRLRADLTPLSALLMAETGKPLGAAKREIQRAARTFDLAASELETWRGDLHRLWGKGLSYGLVDRVPLGPVIGITPSNSPVNLAAHKIAPAIAVGAPIVLKPHEEAPLAVGRVARYITDLPLPVGAFSFLPGGAEIGNQLVADSRYAVLTFTGSELGWRLKQMNPKRRAVLELGGNAAVIVNDGDPVRAAEKVAAGAFDSSGQSCISTQRVLVQDSIYEPFLRALIGAAAEFVPMDPSDSSARLRPLAEHVRDRLKSTVDEAVQDGATLRCGGDSDGSFFTPTVLTSVSEKSDVWSGEVFGPVVSVRRYGRIDEAIEAVNRSLFGIHTGLITDSHRLAFEVFQRLEVTGLVVGGDSDFRDDALPYGGTKDSGYGREGVRSTMMEFTVPRTMMFRL